MAGMKERIGCNNVSIFACGSLAKVEGPEIIGLQHD